MITEPIHYPPTKPTAPVVYLVLRAISYRLCGLDLKGRWCEDLKQAHGWNFDQARGLAAEHRAVYCKAQPIWDQLRTH